MVPFIRLMTAIHEHKTVLVVMNRIYLKLFCEYMEFIEQHKRIAEPLKVY